MGYGRYGGGIQMNIIMYFLFSFTVMDPLNQASTLSKENPKMIIILFDLYRTETFKTFIYPTSNLNYYQNYPEFKLVRLIEV